MPGNRNISDILSEETWNNLCVCCLVAELPTPKTTTHLILLLLVQWFESTWYGYRSPFSVCYFNKWIYCTAVSYEALRSAIQIIFIASTDSDSDYLISLLTTVSLSGYTHRQTVQRWQTGTYSKPQLSALHSEGDSFHGIFLQVFDKRFRGNLLTDKSGWKTNISVMAALCSFPSVFVDSDLHIWHKQMNNVKQMLDCLALCKRRRGRKWREKDPSK